VVLFGDTMLKHNKKRNVGLINEFFARYIAKAIIEQKDSDITKAKMLFRKHFHKGTDLYKELKLFNALYKTKVQNKEAAYSLINQVKEACKIQSQQRIDLEKTALLHEVNCTLNDVEFFNRGIPDYKICATIQVLLNSWRMGALQENIGETSQLEDKLLEHLVVGSQPDHKPQTVDNVLGMTNKDVNQLVINIMLEKLHAKFGGLLNEEQKKIINMYVFANDNEEIRSKLSESLESIRVRTDKLLEEEIQSQKDEYTNKKLVKIKGMLQEDYRDTTSLQDDTITFYLSVIKLEKELTDASA
jgi:hypothetical protein